MAETKELTQADIDAAIEKATAPLKESVDKLTEKNTQLIGENRKLKSAGEIRPEDLAAAEDRADKAEAALAEANKQIKLAAADKEKVAKALETESAFTQKLLIQDGIKSSLIANGVKDEDFIDSLAAKFSNGATIVTEGDARKAMYGDKPLGDFIKEWASSDVGKKFVAAPANGGGGASGSSSNASGGKQIDRPAFDAMGQAERGTFLGGGGKVVDA